MKVVLGHIFDAIERLVHSINTPDLHPVDRMRSLDMPYHLVKIYDGAAQSMGDENRRPLGPGLQQHKGREAWSAGLLEEGSQSCDGRRLVDHHRWQLSTTGIGDGVKEFQG